MVGKAGFKAATNKSMRAPHKIQVDCSSPLLSLFQTHLSPHTSMPSYVRCAALQRALCGEKPAACRASQRNAVSSGEPHRPWLTTTRWRPFMADGSSTVWVQLTKTTAPGRTEEVAQGQMIWR